MAELAQERTLQDVLAALGGGGGAAATEATLLAVKAATEATAVALEPGGDTQSQLVSLVVGQSDGNQLARCMGISDNIDQKQIKVNGDGEVVTVDIAHYKIHDGDHFDACVDDVDVDTAAPKYILIRVPAAPAPPPHMAIEYESSASGGLWELFRVPTTTADGTAVAVFNTRDDVIPAGNGTLIFQDPTVAALGDGTKMTAYFQGSSGGTGRTGGSSGSRAERVLANGTDYLVKFTPTADNTRAICRFYFYECLCG